MRHYTAGFISAIFVLLLSVNTIFGQTASLTGAVTDPQGGAIAGATITATNTATGASRTTVSARDGAYQIPQLPPGNYRVRAEAKGFVSVAQESVTVAVDTAVTLNIQFTQLGAVSETVTVQGGESTLNTSDATVGNAFNERQIRQLPLEGRNVVGLLYGYTRQGVDFIGAATARETVTFRSIHSIEPLTRSNGRIVPTHNFVDDLTWVKDGHTFGLGTNVRFIRNDQYNFANSFNGATTNASWLLGTGADLRPAGIERALRVSFSDAMMALLGIVSFGTANYNYDKTGRLAPVGEVVKRRFAADEYEWYGQDSWRARPNLTITAGLRYGLYSPPYETNGNQVKPNVSLGDWFNQRGVNGQRGVPSNAAPPISFDLAGPANGRSGFYDWDKNNFAPRFAVDGLLMANTVGAAGTVFLDDLAAVPAPLLRRLGLLLGDRRCRTERGSARLICAALDEAVAAELC